MRKIKKIAPYIALFFGFAMYVAAFEPFGVAEFAYVFAVPAFLVARHSKISARAWKVSSFLFAWFAWFAILIWIRHVYPPSGFFFLIALSLIVGLFLFAWLLALRRIVLASSDTLARRLFSILFLSSLWVFLEWVRSFLFTGFPWLLLGHSQWMRPAMIQTAEFGGVYIVSFVLIFFNLALAEFFSKIWKKHKERVAKLSGEKFPRFRMAPSVELYIAVAMIFGGFWLYVSNLKEMSSPREGFKVGMVQPDFAGIMRWDAALEEANFETIRNLTAALVKADVDVTLWPESSTPPRYPVLGVPAVKKWIEEVCKNSGKTILMGNGAYVEENGVGKSYNATFAVCPEKGLSEEFYAKQKLVPFGEYLPSWCFFVNKTVVPVGGLEKGKGPVLLNATIADSDYKVGSIICYEDIFPHIGREAVAAGADLLFVCTNDSWYGREGGAWQHAAHSVFQAVSTRRPLLRSSINGVSGVIDQFGRFAPTFALRNENNEIFDGTGRVSEVFEIVDEKDNNLDAATLERKKGGPLVNDAGSVYFRGAGFVDLVFYDKFDSYETLYVRFGDWFPKLCGIFLALAIFLRKKCLTPSREK